jgi:hypothetical protein
MRVLWRNWSEERCRAKSSISLQLIWFFFPFADFKISIWCRIWWSAVWWRWIKIEYGDYIKWWKSVPFINSLLVFNLLWENINFICSNKYRWSKLSLYMYTKQCMWNHLFVSLHVWEAFRHFKFSCMLRKERWTILVEIRKSKATVMSMGVDFSCEETRRLLNDGKNQNGILVK